MHVKINAIEYRTGTDTPLFTPFPGGSNISGSEINGSGSTTNAQIGLVACGNLILDCAGQTAYETADDLVGLRSSVRGVLGNAVCPARDPIREAGVCGGLFIP
jgi:hypothetical protein